MLKRLPGDHRRPVLDAGSLFTGSGDGRARNCRSRLRSLVQGPWQCRVRVELQVAAVVGDRFDQAVTDLELSIHLVSGSAGHGVYGEWPLGDIRALPW